MAEFGQVKHAMPGLHPAQTDAAQSRAPSPTLLQNGVPQNNPIPLERLEKDPAYIECPFCLARGRSTVTYTDTDATCRIALGCCCALGVLGVWMPYVFHWGADVDHHCSACKRLVVHREHYGGTVQVYRPGKETEPDEKAPYVAMPGMEKNFKVDENPVLSSRN
ncbi:uncharacterized protein LY89DRAFT_777212 [Mollisia scopiformis]|uniref:LITAF domain-containing protein n=1 Tax=Mollisia scopiformis TaxID=149040 RepID=A0A194XTJ7_MOLSC|nr:uncharacterized protein LY89DRAFT_777212 [Mollisia scopiformis]KUJ23466.1 hypothetical protein LY89DRAFT_777212 [Mollisia scopiformis]